MAPADPHDGNPLPVIKDVELPATAVPLVLDQLVQLFDTDVPQAILNPPKTRVEPVANIVEAVGIL